MSSSHKGQSGSGRAAEKLEISAGSAFEMIPNPFVEKLKLKEPRVELATIAPAVPRQGTGLERAKQQEMLRRFVANHALREEKRRKIDHSSLISKALFVSVSLVVPICLLAFDAQAHAGTWRADLDQFIMVFGGFMAFIQLMERAKNL